MRRRWPTQSSCEPSARSIPTGMIATNDSRAAGWRAMCSALLLEAWVYGSVRRDTHPGNAVGGGC